MNSHDLIPVLVAFIAATPGFLSWRQSRKNKGAIHEVHLSVNSRLDELLKASKAESKAEGVVQGRAEKLHE